MRSLLLLGLLATALPGGARQEPEAPVVRAADEVYPQRREERVVRFLLLETDEPDVGAMNEALRELEARIVYGPRTTEGRPGRAFFAVELPWGVSGRQLERAARKGGAKAGELDCVAFEGRDDRDTKIDVGALGFTSRDFVMGMSGEIAWFDSVGGWSQFYGEPGDLEAEELIERYEKLVGPFGGGSLGRLVRERFTWTLPATPDARAAKKLLAAARKLDGVREVSLEGAALSVEVALEGLVACRPAGALAAQTGADDAFDAAGLAAPRAAFATRALWELLEEHDLAPAGAR